MVPPDWHGWLHHMTDSPGTDSAAYLTEKLKDKLEIGVESHAPYEDHLGRSGESTHSLVLTDVKHPAPHTHRADYEPEFMTNWSQFRHRGYKMGSLHMGPDEDEKFWTQPGHMLNTLNKRESSYNTAEHKGVHTVDLSKPADADAPQRNDLLDGKN